MQTIRYRTAGTDPHVVHGLLVKETAKRIHVILMEPAIRVKKLPASEGRHITPISIPVRRAKKQLRQAAKTWGNTLSKECRGYLRDGG